ncbi:prophage LambdaW4 minor capsid protein C putative [Wolbachia endosymbiont of Onchocerca ochengi]|nr:prophage LambdaW4 minor capsid protein C putative [Wolbachia endosymbiont of Onchocerca ochengi]
MTKITYLPNRIAALTYIVKKLYIILYVTTIVSATNLVRSLLEVEGNSVDTKCGNGKIVVIVDDFN